MIHPSEFTRNGYRALTPDEGDQLKVGDVVTILNSSDGTHTKGSVIGMRREQARVMFMRSGHILPFDLDDPDLWADREFRDRRAPMATEDETLFVLVTQAPVPILSVEIVPPRVSDMPLPTFAAADARMSAEIARMPQMTASPLFNALKASTEFNTVAKQLSDLLNKLAAINERLDRLESLTAPRSV